MPPIDPQQIPYQPTQPPPAQPFQGGPYAQVASEQIAKTPTALDWAQLGSQGVNEGLKNYLESQRLKQQAPLIQAQTGLAQTQTLGEQQKLYGGQLVSPSTGQPDQGYTLSGVSSSAPQPGGGVPPPSGGTMPQGNQPPMGGGQGQQMPMGIQGSVGGGFGAGQPQAPADPFSHMHPDPNNPYSLPGNPKQPQGQGQPQGMIPRGQLLQFQQNEQAYQAEAKLLAQSPSFKSLFGSAQSQDILPMLRGSGQAGEMTKGLMQMEATRNTLAQKYGMFNTDKQVKANEEASKMYSDYVDKSQSITGALDSLAQAATNPAAFNTQLLAVGDALGIKARRPSAVIEVLSGGDPSLTGRMTEALTKGGSGQLTQDLKDAFTQRIGAIQQQAKAGFEQKATAHAQQNAQFFGGSVDNAKQALFPQYQWNRSTSTTPSPGTPTQTYSKIMQNSKTGQKVGWDGKQWVPIQ